MLTFKQFYRIEEESTAKRMEKAYKRAVQVVTRVIINFIELTKVDQWGNYLITFILAFLSVNNWFWQFC